MTHTSRFRFAPRHLGWAFLLLASLALAAAPVAARQAAPAEHAAPAAPEPSAAPEHASDATAAPQGHAEGQPAATPEHGAAAPAEHPAPAHGEAAHGEAAGEHGGEHAESLVSFLSRIANFVILAGGLVYLLRSPIGKYLSARAEQIRLDLVNAADTRKAAAAELARIEARMKELPAEIEALKQRGLGEVQAEQVRIKETAATERERLLEQARREIDQQVAAARRTLKQDAADLVVGIARRQVEVEMTDADRGRLVDRYVAQVKTAHD
jgi:F-type H+-transporting ATPase subunit b